MVSFVPFDGNADLVNDVLRKAYEKGVICFMAGHHPTKIRMLLPGGAITDAELEAGFDLIAQALEESVK
jgi:4-aminobutyrate aminotransferase-like enzyme